MRCVPDIKDANMVRQVFDETINIDDSLTITVRVPCAVNKCGIKAGDELVIHRPAVQQEPRTRTTTAANEPLQKKARI